MRKKKNKYIGKYEKENSFRNFGDLTNDSISNDFFKKTCKFDKNYYMPKATKCNIRKMTDEEYKKYFGGK